MEKKDNTIVLFINDKGNNPARPDLKGTITVNGKEYGVALWRKESANKLPYFSGTLKEETQQTQTQK